MKNPLKIFFSEFSLKIYCIFLASSNTNSFPVCSCPYGKTIRKRWFSHETSNQFPDNKYFKRALRGIKSSNVSSF